MVPLDRLLRPLGLDILYFESTFPMLGIVQAGDFFLRRDAQAAGDPFGQVGHQQRAHRRKGRRADNGKKLDSDLPRIASICVSV